MKKSVKARLERIEGKKNDESQRYRSAMVVCDPEILHSFDTSMIKADFVVVLPDNGRRAAGQVVPKGSYMVDYL